MYLPSPHGPFLWQQCPHFPSEPPEPLSEAGGHAPPHCCCSGTHSEGSEPVPPQGARDETFVRRIKKAKPSLSSRMARRKIRKPQSCWGLPLQKRGRTRAKEEGGRETERERETERGERDSQGNTVRAPLSYNHAGTFSDTETEHHFYCLLEQFMSWDSCSLGQGALAHPRSQRLLGGKPWL